LSISDIMGARTTSRERKMPVSLALGSKFDKYKPEEEKEVRKLDAREEEVLMQLKAAWKGFRHGSPTTEEDYKNASEQVRAISYSARDVENFSIVLAEFQDEEKFSERAGIFLSALINNGTDSDYVIHTQHLSQATSELGYRNIKNIIVDGDAGEWVGLDMKEGSITVHGNVKVRLGNDMLGGTITVNGDVDAYVGSSMKGGCIIVNGYGGDSAGLAMKGGEIHLNGDYEPIMKVNVFGGKIYHKGVLIVDK